MTWLLYPRLQREVDLGLPDVARVLYARPLTSDTMTVSHARVSSSLQLAERGSQ